MMKRRTFLCVLTFGALSAPLAAEAQQAGKVPRVGILLIAAREQTAHFVKAFEEGMRALGYVEGRNIVYEHRFANGKPALLPDLAAEMVRLSLGVIVTGSNQQTVVVKRATTAVPIVAMFLSEPVASGLISSFSRPGGNLTGLTVDVDAEIWSKRVELLKEAAPRVQRVAILVDSAVPGREPYRKAIEDALRRLDMTGDFIGVRSAVDFESAFGSVKRQGRDALFFDAGPLFFGNLTRITELVARSGLPSAYPSREFVETGGLLSYGANLPDLSRRAAIYVDKILKGTKPADLPVEQPAKFELVINMKTAKALGLTIPPSLLLRADQVIE